MTTAARLLVEPGLLSLLRTCTDACGLTVAEDAEVRTSYLSGRLNLSADQPVAIVLDGRFNSADIKRYLQGTIAPTLLYPLIIIVERLDDARFDCVPRSCHLATPQEVGSGRLARLLKSLAADTRREICSGSPDAGKLQLQSLTEKTRAMVSLNQIAVEMMNRVELPSLLQHIAAKTADLTSADYAYVAMVHESGDYLETVAANDNFRSLKSVRHRHGEGIGGQVWASGQTVCVPDYQNYPHRLPGLTTARQACSVPLKLCDEVIGVIGILYESNDFAVENQVDLLEMFAPLASVAIENATLYENTLTELARTQAISNISRAIYGAASFDDIIDQICITLIDVFDSTKVHLYKLEDDNSFTPLAAWENIDNAIVPTMQSGGKVVATSVARWCVVHQKTGFIRRGVNDERESAEVHRIRARWKLGSTLCLPLVYENKSWGVLFAHRSLERSDFSVRERHLFELVCAQISVALLRRELMEKVQYQAYHDSLTGLTNRYRFEKLLAYSVERLVDTEDWFAVLFIDLDGFKNINDYHGHGVGDCLLQQVAEILKSHMAETDVLARMGGDEFAALISSPGERTEVIAIAERINASLSVSVPVQDLKVDIGCSIGVSFYPGDACTSEEVLKHADFAMYHAKGAGQSGVSVFNKSHLEYHEKRIQTELDLHRAVEAGEFLLYYQPKVCGRTGIVDGVEALIRWNHPTLGFISPAEFIPAAERCGLIEVIGHWVLDEACRQCAEFLQRGLPLSMAVNISARQFSVENFVQGVFNLLGKHRLPASCLELEVTESVVMKDVAMVVNKLAQLRSCGIKIAIDDFGTGYSSLQYLAELPLDVLKIDKSFVDKLCNAAEEHLLVKTIVMLASELQLKTVAEGVETDLQLQKLTALGCDYIQGYYYSRPVPASELPAVVAAINQSSLHREAA